MHSDSDAIIRDLEGCLEPDQVAYMRELKEYQKMRDKALHCRSALRHGMTLEQFEQIWADKSHHYSLASWNDPLREEVLTADFEPYTESPSLIELKRRRLSAELGREVTVQETYRYMLDDMARMTVDHEEIERFKQQAVDERAALERLRGPDCLSPAELHAMFDTGAMPEGKAEHAATCELCGHERAEAFQGWIEKVAPMPKKPHKPGKRPVYRAADRSPPSPPSLFRRLLAKLGWT